MRNAMGVLAQLGGILLMLAASPSIAQNVPASTTEGQLYDAAKKEGKVVLYTSNALDQTNAVAADFAKDYPGVDVVVTRLVGMAQYQRFMMEVDAKQNIADVVNLTDQPALQALIEAGHIAHWKTPTFARFPDEFKISDGAYSVTRTIPVILYNENKVTAEEADILRASWSGVLDPRFKNRFAVQTQKCGLCYVGVHLFQDPANPGKLPQDFIAKVAAQSPAVYSDIMLPIDRVSAGEKDFTFWSWEAVAATKRASGAPVRWVYPNPTPTFANNYFSVSAYAPHPNGARLFLNWLTGDKGAASLQNRFSGATTLLNFPDGRSFTREPWFRAIKDVYAVDYKRWSEKYDDDMSLWISSMTKRQ